MSDREAFAYLMPPPYSIWQWADDGRVMLWKDGTTIAFLPELHAAVARLAPHGLPPLGALAVLMAAMRDSWSDSEAQRGTLAGYIRNAIGYPTDSEMPFADRALLTGAMENLNAVAALPDELRKGVEARALLAEMFFEGVETATPVEIAWEVVEVLKQRIPYALAIVDAAGNNSLSAGARAILTALAAGRRLANPDAIDLRRRTGLEEVPQDANLHISQRVRGLLDQLRGDEELAGLANLARALMAVIATPRLVNPDTDLPLGGLSDVTNRGPLDRLLLTELAHDELTLAVRIALREALYLRRESPRMPRAFHRTILLDSGIRLWGVPRVYALATALALAAATPKNASLTVLTSAGGKLAAVDLSTRSGLLSQLENLDPAPHPGAALQSLAQNRGQIKGARHETVMITHPNTAADGEFQRQVHEAGMYPYLLATVTGSGRFLLQACGLAGRKPLASATLKLDELLPNDPQRAPLINPRPEMPAYLALEDSPFNLPTQLDPSRAISSERHGLLAIVGRSLRQWQRVGIGKKRGPVLPAGALLGPFLDPIGPVAAVAAWQEASRTLVIHAVDLETHQTKVHLPRSLSEAPRHTFLNGGVLLLVAGVNVTAVRLMTGDGIGTYCLGDDFEFVGTRFVRDGKGKYFAICLVGTAICLLPVRSFDGQGWLFDRIGMDGPMVVFQSGIIASSTGDFLVSEFTKSLGFSRVIASHEGNRLVAFARESSARRCIDLTKSDPQWKELGAVEPDLFLLGKWAQLMNIQNIPLRRRFLGIARDNLGDIVLMTRRGTYLSLDTKALCFGAQTGRHRATASRPFEHLAKSPSPFELSVANFPDGSRAFLDSRGILHLRSSDPFLPELSILLLDSATIPITAWSSDGATFGFAPYLCEKPTGTSSRLIELLRAFARRLN